ncbi:MAG: EamA family transporter [Bacteroidales bacterium]|nr:EamA family transporter [Candidatus Sodaliphilus aphodohippi]
MISKYTRGLVAAMISSSTFGMIPLFSMPCLAAGMTTLSVVTYRYAIASLAMLILMLLNHQNLRITMGDFWRLMLLAVFNNMAAVLIIYGYNFMDTGAATTIQFSYPMFTCIIMMLFFGEKATVRTITAIILAMAGVACLSGISSGGGDNTRLLIGIILELGAGLTYSVYLVMVPQLKTSHIESSKLTFYVFLCSTLQLLMVAPFVGGIQPIDTTSVMLNLALLGIVPTAVSNYTLIIGLKNIGSTLTSILGALEPLTAMLIGIWVFGEKMTFIIGIGFVAIIIAVTMLVVPQKNTSSADA